VFAIEVSPLLRQASATSTTALFLAIGLLGGGLLTAAVQASPAGSKTAAQHGRRHYSLSAPLRRAGGGSAFN
jgi:hypothetical protein